MSYKRTVRLDAPVEIVFDFFTNPANWQELAGKGLVYSNVNLTPEGVGTTYEWTAKVAGASIRGFNEYTEFVPNRRITDRCSRGFEGTWTYTFEPDGSGTRLTLENQTSSFWRVPPVSWLMDWETAMTHDPVMRGLQARMTAR